MSPPLPTMKEMRAAYAILADRAESWPGCPPPERIWDAARGLVSRRAVRVVALHSVACPSCAQAYRVAKVLSAEALGDSGRTVRSGWLSRRSFRRSIWHIVGATAAVLALSVGIAQVLHFRGAAAPGFRGPRTAEIRSLVPSEISLPRARCVLRWSGVAGASYEVQVAARGFGKVAAAEGLAAPEFRVPEASLTGLSPGEMLFWQVDAILPDGRRVSSRSFISKID